MARIIKTRLIENIGWVKPLGGREAFSVTHPEVAEEWDYEKNHGFTPDQFSPGSVTDSWWRCRQNPEHSWRAQIVRRTLGTRRCPHCLPGPSLAQARRDLLRQWDWEKNGDLNPRTISASSTLKVWWCCTSVPEHSWQATIRSRVRSTGCCKQCYRSRMVSSKHSLATTHPHLADEWDFNKNAPVKPDQISAESRKKMWWLCGRTDNHSWRASIALRANGKSTCPVCQPVKKISLAAGDPQLALEWCTRLNGKLSPSDVSLRTSREVWWQCPNSHQWKCRINARSIKGSGCPHCRKQFPMLCETHPQLAAEWHPTRNGALTPAVVRRNAQIRVWWQCVKDSTHEWEAFVHRRIYTNAQCPFCRRKHPGAERIANLDIFKEWHPLKNGEQNSADVSSKSGQNVWWQCQIDSSHEWTARVASRVNGHASCPFCKLTKRASSRRSQFANEWHPNRNGDLKISSLSDDSDEEVWWQCQDNPSHEWSASINKRITSRNANCPICRRASRRNHYIYPRSLLILHPTVALEFDTALNGGKKAGEIRAQSRKFVWWRCLNNQLHSWTDSPYARTVLGRGCFHCKRMRESYQPAARTATQDASDQQRLLRFNAQHMARLF